MIYIVLHMKHGNEMFQAERFWSVTAMEGNQLIVKTDRINGAEFKFQREFFLGMTVHRGNQN